MANDGKSTILRTFICVRELVKEPVWHNWHAIKCNGKTFTTSLSAPNKKPCQISDDIACTSCVIGP